MGETADALASVKLPETLPARETFRWYVELWRPLRSILVRLAFLTVISAVLRVALPTLFQPVIDQCVSEGRAAPWIVALIVSVGVLRSIVYGLLQYTRASTNFALGKVARERTFDHLTELGPDLYVKHPTGDLLARLTDDCGEQKMSWFACSGVFRLAEAALVVAFALAAMARISPALTLVACAPLPLIALLYLALAGRLDGLFASVQKRVSALEGFLDALFTGIRAVKANGLERAQADHFEGLVASHRDASVSAETAQASVELLYGYGWQLVLPALVYFGGRLIVTHELDFARAPELREGLTAGAFMSFYGLTLLLVWPMLDLGSFIVRFRQSGASVARLAELERAVPEVVAPASGTPASVERGLALSDVTRKSEDGRRTLLQAVSFPVKKGETTAVVGEVGSGKSTILRLLPRIMDPRPGSVAKDERDLREVDLGAWRRSLGYVPQEAHLLSATIDENIRLGRTDLSEDRVRRACEVARLSQDLAALPQGLATKVGERGTMLSGGQRQRVAIARALAHEPSLLVLDDVGAALDADTEAALWDALERERPGLTKVVATHRPALIERAHQVVVLDRGRVADRGTHKELLERCEIYKRIYVKGRLVQESGRLPSPHTAS